MPERSALARLQQAITLAWLVALLASLYAGLWLGHRWALLVSALLVAGHALVLGIEVLLLAMLHRGQRGADGVPLASVRQLWRAWWHESLTAVTVFGWAQPWRWRSEPDHLLHESDRPPVVLVHGFVCNRGLWLPWVRRLRSERRACVAVNLEPVFGRIDDYAALIDAAVTRVTQATGRVPRLVCHSMGGLAARAWLASPGAMQRVERIVTIGTPHHGTWLARWGHTPNARQMRLDSPWIVALSARENPTDRDRFDCVFSNADHIVFPPATARLDGARPHFVPGVPHVALVFDPRVMDLALGDGSSLSGVGL